jgi:hypothetical protein
MSYSRKEEAAGTKYFNGKPYHLHLEFPFRSHAEQDVKLLRKEGLSARISYTPTRGVGYAVYYRGKR